MSPPSTPSVITPHTCNGGHINVTRCELNGILKKYSIFLGLVTGVGIVAITFLAFEIKDLKSK